MSATPELDEKALEAVVRAKCKRIAPNDPYYYDEYGHNLVASLRTDLTAYLSATSTAQSERERVLVEALTQIEGGHVPGMASLVLAHDWHAVVNLFQSISRAALKAAP